MTTRCGYIALLGAPNAGKSTLLNQLVGQKLAIVTPKAQTTRSRITGVVIHGEAQLIFADAPGVFAPTESQRFERAMVDAAWRGVADADIVAVMIDARRGLDEENTWLLERVKETVSGKPAILILNKIDLIDKERLLALTVQCTQVFPFDRVFYISALKGDGTKEINDYAAERVPQGPWLFPEDYLTDLPERLIASEITREKLFLILREELPYALHVETEQWEVKKDGSIRIQQVITVEREGQKGIILGKNGAMLKRIGQSAREDISNIWEVDVHLFLFVKVRSDWKSNPESYRYLGLNF